MSLRHVWAKKHAVSNSIYLLHPSVLPFRSVYLSPPLDFSFYSPFAPFISLPLFWPRVENTRLSPAAFAPASFCLRIVTAVLVKPMLTSRLLQLLLCPVLMSAPPLYSFQPVPCTHFTVDAASAHCQATRTRGRDSVPEGRRQSLRRGSQRGGRGAEEGAREGWGTGERDREREGVSWAWGLIV